MYITYFVLQASVYMLSPSFCFKISSNTFAISIVMREAPQRSLFFLPLRSGESLSHLIDKSIFLFIFRKLLRFFPFYIQKSFFSIMGIQKFNPSLFSIKDHSIRNITLKVAIRDIIHSGYFSTITSVLSTPGRRPVCSAYTFLRYFREKVTGDLITVHQNIVRCPSSKSWIIVPVCEIFRSLKTYAAGNKIHLSDFP